MCIKVFILRHHFDSPSDATDSFFRDMLECNRGVDMSEIKYIELFDKYSEKDNDYNFHLRLSIDDLLKFVRKYSEKVLEMKGVNLNKNGKESG